MACGGLGWLWPSGGDSLAGPRAALSRPGDGQIRQMAWQPRQSRTGGQAPRRCLGALPAAGQPREWAAWGVGREARLQDTAPTLCPTVCPSPCPTPFPHEGLGAVDVPNGRKAKGGWRVSGSTGNSLSWSPLSNWFWQVVLSSRRALGMHVGHPTLLVLGLFSYG